jgi:ferrous iron transport protein B
VDLPGTYSLTAYSAEELVARNFIIEEKPDVVVDILDTSNLERNLYLAVQLMELGVPLVLAFNMSDMAKARGYEFDLEKALRVLRGPYCAHRGAQGERHGGASRCRGQDGNRRCRPRGPKGRRFGCGQGVFQSEHSRASPRAAGIKLWTGNRRRDCQNRIPHPDERGGCQGKYDSRWAALKLLENDKEMRTRIGSPEVDDQIEKSASHIEKILGESPETAVAGRRYGFISGACQEAVRSTIELRHTLSDRIDAVVTNRVLGIPVFLGLMYLAFHLTFTLGDPPMGWIEEFFGWAAGRSRGGGPKGRKACFSPFWSTASSAG